MSTGSLLSHYPLWILVLLMGAVTYIPRLLPMVALQNTRLPSYLRRFLQLIPFAVLGALIFPGVLFSTGNVRSAAAGGVAAVILAYFRVNLMVVVCGAVLGVFLWQLYLG